MSQHPARPDEARPGEGQPETAGPDDVAADDVDQVIDARGLSCPMPVLELAKAIDAVEIGGRVRLLATDPAAKVDVPVWCRMQRQRLRSHHLDDHVWHFEVERSH